MQFFTIAALFAVSALAAPSTVVPATAADIHKLSAQGCNIINCAVALAPTIIGCAAAAAQEFLDPFSDAACIAAAANAGINPPSACTSCF